MAPASPSPHKPRLLWRGALHLPDGTALPGVAIVSSILPTFSSHNQNGTSKSSSNGVTASGSAQTDKLTPPFTLTKEQQDALSLSIEMVRHAPMQIVDVIEEAEVDEKGALSLPRVGSAVSGGDTLSARPTSTSLAQLHVTFEAAGDVRLYIDPTQDSTVAYFERIFAYGAGGGDEARRRGTSGRDKGTSSTSPAAIVFSLDKTLAHSTSASGPIDVFANPNWATSDGGGMEAVIIGVRRSPVPDVVELHIGRKIARRQPIRASSTGALPSSSAAASSSIDGRSARPDDPAPRGLARILSKPSRSSSSSSLTTGLLAGARRPSSEFAIPPPPSLLRRSQSQGRRPSGSGSSLAAPSDVRPNGSSVAAQSRGREVLGEESTSSSSSSSMSAMPPSPTAAIKRRGGSHTPGRRGEKRARLAGPVEAGTAKAEMSDAKDAQQQDAPAKAVKGGGSGIGGCTTTAASGSIEERNRSMIKKLVHYQLLGRGVERQEDAYLACFGPTCQGALVAMRKTAKGQLLDRQAAASIVERHLDMYL